jgi:hypothetical protein
MGRQIVGILIPFVCLGLVGCGSEAAVGTGPSEKAASDAPASVPANEAPAPAKPLMSAGAVSVEEFVGRMDAIGPDSQQQYDSALARLRKDAVGLASLKAFYSALPSSELGTRWKAVYLAGEFESSEAVTFLEEVALAPDTVLTAYETHRLRSRAGVGIVRAYVRGVPDALASVERLLEAADKDIAQLVGLELFTRGMLTKAFRSRLEARGISATFRLPTKLELSQLQADPSLGARSPENAERLRSMTVPALTAEEAGAQ